MPATYPAPWLPRILFYLIMVLGVGLVGVVLAAPWLDRGENRAIELLARDALLRRTALVSAGGLAVTACVFFRAPGLPRRLEKAAGAAATSTRRRVRPPARSASDGCGNKALSLRSRSGLVALRLVAYGG